MLGIEEYTRDGKRYLFKADFRFLANVKKTVEDPFLVYETLASGQYDPEMIKGVMLASLKSVNGSEEFKDIEDEIEALITSEGLQDCHHLARTLLTHAMIGDKKKHELYKVEKRATIVQVLAENFRLMNSKNQRSLLASVLLISGVSICTTFSLYAWLSA